MKLINLLIGLVFGYVFYADILIAFTHFSYIKIFLAVFILLVFGLNIVVNNQLLRHKKILLYAIVISFIYLIVWRGIGQLNLLYTIILGWILFQNPSFTFKCLFYLFIIQFICIFYETISHSFLYTEITSGTINQNEYDYSGVVDFFSDTGFRPKGLFPGTLIGASFIIYYALLMRNNLLMTICIFIMAYLLNGRMAMIVSFVTLLLCVINNMNLSHQKRKISVGMKILIGITLVSIFALIIYNMMSSVRIDHILSIFDTNNVNNAGRVFRYVEGLTTYLQDYNIIGKLFGRASYELFDLYGRPIPPESEIVGMLLEIGVVGLLIYFFILKKVWQKDKYSFINLRSRFISLKYVVFWTFICMLQYRHIAGNQRGTLFWFVFLFLLFDQELKDNNKQISIII